MAEFIQPTENIHFSILDIIKTISLASVDPDVGEICTVSGWGRDSDSSSTLSPVLRYVDVPILSNPQCNIYGIVWEGMICIDTEGGKGTCTVRFLYHSTVTCIRCANA